MQKRRVLLILIILIAVAVAGGFGYMRFIRAYVVGKDPKLSEITSVYCMSTSTNPDYGHVYNKYTVRKKDQKYYAETDIFDEQRGEQVVISTEITNAEYTEILKLIEGSRYERQGKAPENVSTESSTFADLIWDRQPNGRWELILDTDKRTNFVNAVNNVVRTISISFVNEIQPSSVWIIRDTPENRKTSIWGTAMIKPEELGKEYTADIPLSVDDKYLFRMIDVDGLYYDAAIPELLSGWTVKVFSDENSRNVLLNVFDDKGELRCECDVFSAAL